MAKDSEEGERKEKREATVFTFGSASLTRQKRHSPFRGSSRVSTALHFPQDRFNRLVTRLDRTHPLVVLEGIETVIAIARRWWWWR